MAYHDVDDDEIFSNPKLLSPTRLGPRRTPSRQIINGRRSSATLRPSTLSQSIVDDDAANGRHSLAHELAVALMPEPSAGQKMLAEEFGIEYDEGAEGIDGDTSATLVNGDSLAHELNGHEFEGQDESAPTFNVEPPMDDPTSQFVSEPSSPVRQTAERAQPQDPMETLSRDLETTDKFIDNLRRLDADVHAGASSSKPTLEKIASDIIRRLNDTVRDREGQVRELLEYDREFRKIAGEVGGEDVLSRLDTLEEVEGLMDGNSSQHESLSTEKQIQESRTSIHSRLRSSSIDWEMNPDDHHLGDDLDGYSDPDSPTPMKDSFLQPPTINGPPTAAKALPQLADMRTITSSLVTSLTAISEHAQVNGATTGDAGRRLRALKNKFGVWKTDWESAERSQIRIEKWEAGLKDGDDDGSRWPVQSGKRLDGRVIVEQQLKAFERALADAGKKTQAIMSVLSVTAA